MSRVPDYRLRVLNKETNQRATVGAGWLNENESISIRLDLCSVLTADPNLVITLFPCNKEATERESDGK